MRASQILFSTKRETSSEAVVISHQLMLRAGLIRKNATGLYSWLPMGVRVLRKVEAIIRAEMNQSGAQETLMPVAQPIELWEKSGRALAYGPELLRFADRHGQTMVLGPTHEEVITDIAANELKSYKQLPVNFYQIQTKFRDEIRPRFGVMRSREFIMKDAYSFHADQASLQQTYDVMHATYCNIFSRIGLNYRAVQADTGSIGGSGSHEFHVLADSGEDDIAFSDSSGYAANVEMAEAICNETRPAASQPLQLVNTGAAHSIDEVCQALQVPANRVLKTLIVQAAVEPVAKGEPLPAKRFVALVLRGDHTLNDIKAEKLSQVASPLSFASDAEISALGLINGVIGPQGLAIEVIVDRAASVLADAVVGANAANQHATGFNWGRDAEPTAIADIRNVVNGDPSPDGQGHLQIKRGIEVGHIFQLGQKYSAAMGCNVLGQDGKPLTVTMGCYGIGVTRVVAAAIEQNYDDKGILWPMAIAPYQVAIVPMNPAKSPQTLAAAEALYATLNQMGLDVLLDDRDERPGVKFADLELLGIPHRIVIGDKGLAAGTYEYKGRRDSDAQDLNLEQVLALLAQAK